MSKCFAVRLNLALKFQLKILSGFEYMYDALKLQALLSYFVLIDVPTYACTTTYITSKKLYKDNFHCFYFKFWSVI